MPEPDDETAAKLDAALARAGIAATPAERARALEAARRLRRMVELLRNWNADDAA